MAAILYMPQVAPASLFLFAILLACKYSDIQNKLLAMLL